MFYALEMAEKYFTHEKDEKDLAMQHLGCELPRNPQNANFAYTAS